MKVCILSNDDPAAFQSSINVWLLMQKIGDFLWFFAKFSVCMLFWRAIHL